ncbi:MAG TPA: hypothetical protein VFI92_14510 [Steroidobacteraceae bacterium]|nr:hypothetical protein [Steroidobacteraceae bacterium]
MRATTLFRLNLHVSLGWWSRRPWADSMTWFDTSAYVPGPHNLAPLLRTSRPRRPARRSEPPRYWQARPAQPSGDRRGIEGSGRGHYGSLHVPAAVRLVGDDEAARLEQARRRIGFTPTKGFLHATVVRPLSRDA